MKQKNKTYTFKEIKTLFENDLPRLYSLASECPNEILFKTKLGDFLSSDDIINPNAARNIRRLVEHDGKTIFELSTETNVRLATISLLWRFLCGQTSETELTVDFLIDLYHQFMQLYKPDDKKPTAEKITQWMKRWPDALNDNVRAIHRENKKRIIDLLIHKIEHRHAPSNRYLFPEGIAYDEKYRLVETWWNDYRFHLTFAAKSASELNKMLGNTLSEETLEIYRRAREKKIPVFVTPYYVSLMNPTGHGYDDQAIRSYVIYSRRLVDTYGNIRAWEKEDVVEAGKPNAAGWLLPNGHNIHRRYPEVAILIPDSMGRACGGLCASCQRMYDFQSERLNFNFDNLRPKESWEVRLKKLMKYFEEDSQLRDILITGGDALMSQTKTLRRILEAVYKMARNKRKANRERPDGEKYAEIQRIRLGSRLPVYLPMRIDKELTDTLREFKEKALEVGIEQFFIQTHFQSPLEVTPEARDAIRKILSTGWTITNQLVYNVAASRRGHTAKLRKVLNELGVLSYYTFSVKGFDENHAVFAPNCRSMQEQREEKILGKLDREKAVEFIRLIKNSKDRPAAIKDFCEKNQIPFVATDRNVLNLPGIGKSMTFVLAGITPDGKRILEFDHDHTRKHSPIIEKMGKIFIQENKSVYQYLLQLHETGEKTDEYSSIWSFTEGETEPQSPLYEYPELPFRISETYSMLATENKNMS